MEQIDSRWAEGYEIIARLGRGSYGEVYRALQRSTGQTVALKVLQVRTGPHAPAKLTQFERFRREIAACSTLQHPNIVRAIDAGTTSDGQLFSVFEYVPGPTLRAVLQEHRALPLRRLREFMFQTLDALVCAHASGIIHRDFKPENIIVSTTGARPNFKVLDFGISAFAHDFAGADIPRLTATDEAVGTPGYAAPEQLRGETPTTKTDLYAWGLVVLECLTGRPAIDGLSVAEVHYQQLSPHEIRLPSELDGHPLGELLRWVSAKQPERRASDASSVYSKLESLSFDDLGSSEGYFTREAPAASKPQRLTEDIVLGPRGERRLLTAVSLRFSVPSVQSSETKTSRAITSDGVSVGISGAPDERGANDDELVEGLLDGLLQDQRLRCQQALQTAGGQLVAFTGNRALGVFGFPQLHEHDARRAARFALDVHQGVTLQSHTLRARSQRELSISGGVHTGLVTLRGDEASADQVAGLVLAEAIDLSDKAQSGEILVSAASELAVRRDLEFQPAGEADFPTSGKKSAVFRLIGERNPFVAMSTSAGAVLLGRARELQRLEQQFQHVEHGIGRSVWLEGEPGVGKSYLLDHFRTALARADRRWLHLRCLPETQQVALHPVLTLVRQQLGLVDLTPEAAVAQLSQALQRYGLETDMSLPLFCPWLQLPLSDPRPPRYAPQRMRELAIEALADLVLALLGDAPAVLALEDLHWCDATTREWITALRTKQKDRGVLLLATTRPGFDSAVKTACAPDDDIQLRGLSDEDAHELIRQLAGDQTLEPALAAEMVKRADGVPLFLEELTRYVISHRIVGGGSIEIPHSLRELLGARLDQLGPAKVTAQVAAVIGRDFDLALLERVAQRESAALLGDVEQLVSAGLVQRQRRVGVPKYRFHHALIQQTAYDNLVPGSREQIHLRVAMTLEAEFPEVVRTEPQVLALHWAAAKDVEKALGYAKRASMDLLMRSSHLELIEQSTLAMSWLKNVPDENARIEHELDLTLPYLLAMMSTRGWADESISDVVARIEHHLTDNPHYSGSFNLLFIVALFHHCRGIERGRALRMAERLLKRAQEANSPRLPMVFVLMALANIHYVDGNFSGIESLVEQAEAAYDIRQHGPLAWQFGVDALVGVLGPAAIISWICGRPSDSRRQLEIIKQHASTLGHPESLAQTLFVSCVLAQQRKDRVELEHESQALALVANEHRLSLFSACADVLGGYAAYDLNRATHGMTRLKAAGQLMSSSYQLSILAEIEVELGMVSEARAHLEQAIAYAMSSGERFWLPHLLVQRARLSRQLSGPVGAMSADLMAAIEEARSRHMLLFELEASVELGSLLGHDKSPLVSIDLANILKTPDEVVIMQAVEVSRRSIAGMLVNSR